MQVGHGGRHGARCRCDKACAVDRALVVVQVLVLVKSHTMHVRLLRGRAQVKVPL